MLEAGGDTTPVGVGFLPVLRPTVAPEGNCGLLDVTPAGVREVEGRRSFWFLASLRGLAGSPAVGEPAALLHRVRRCACSGPRQGRSVPWHSFPGWGHPGLTEGVAWIFVVRSSLNNLRSRTFGAGGFCPSPPVRRLTGPSRGGKGQGSGGRFRIEPTFDLFYGPDAPLVHATPSSRPGLSPVALSETVEK